MLPQTVKIKNSDYQDSPSYTYKIDWENHHISGFVDGKDAIKQATNLHLSTERYAWIIYSWQYGSELNTLIGKPIDYVISEMKRMIKDALIVDRRIRDVTDFKFTINGKDITCKFKIRTLEGDSNMEIDLNA